MAVSSLLDRGGKRGSADPPSFLCVAGVSVLAYCGVSRIEDVLRIGQGSNGAMSPVWELEIGF